MGYVLYSTVLYSTLLYSNFTLLYFVPLSSSMYCTSSSMYVPTALYYLKYSNSPDGEGGGGGEGEGRGGLGWDCAFWIVLPTFENSETPDARFFCHTRLISLHTWHRFFFRTLAMLYIVPAYLQYVQYLLSEMHKSEQKIPSLLYSEGYREGGVGNLYTENSPSNRFTTYLQYLPTYLLIAGFFTMAGFTNSEV